MKSLSALNKFFNDGSYGYPKKTIQDFKVEVDELSLDERKELGRMSAEALGQPFEE